jgi:aspartyl protease family protein
MLKPLLVVSSAVCASLIACAATAAVSRAWPAPSEPSVSVRVAKAADGHFWTRATTDAAGVDVLVDTGASSVALTAADARALGLAPERLAYDRAVVTAAGRVRAAPVTLARLAVGAVEVRDVPAVVVEHGLERSLLGMSFLGRLKGFSADARGLTLVR